MHESLTITAVYGHDDGAGSLPALLKSLSELPGSRGLLLSTHKPPGLPDRVEWRSIPPLSYTQYSVFMMHCLHTFIETDFCLIVQEDGWVLDGSQFRHSHYEYDYIGAPCHAAVVGSKLVQGFRWTGMADPIVVQNGGFSLRSRRFLEAPSRLGLSYRPDDRAPLGNEDIQLTGIFRHRLEAAGIRFAPLDVAREFAIEYLAPGFHDGLPFEKLVGQHARSRRLVSEKRVRIGMTLDQAGKVFREPEVLNHLVRLGYELSFPAVDGHHLDNQ
jgi:hypothetical protein